MLLLIKEKISDRELIKAGEDLDGYVKVVLDIEKEILTAGGVRHVEGEQLLLKQGSQQNNLWGGGLDLETGEIDFDSMINIRVADNNPSREVLSEPIRKRMVEIINKLLK